MTTVVYGGTFGPFHIGHVEAIRWLLAQGYDVIVVPAIGHEGKPESMASYLDRRHMVYLAVEEAFGLCHTRLDIMLLEERLLTEVGAPVMAIDILRDLHKLTPCTLRFAIGPDIDPTGRTPGTTMWTGYPEIIAEGFDFVRMPAFHADVHGTEIRRRITAGDPWEHLVPASVAAYIKFRGLYGHSAPVRQWMPLAA